MGKERERGGEGRREGERGYISFAASFFEVTNVLQGGIYLSILCAASWLKLQVWLAVFPGHSKLIEGQPVLMMAPF